MTGYSEQLTPAERARRKSANAKAERLVTRLGFRRVIARPGWWYHEEIGQTQIVQLTGDCPVENRDEVLQRIYWTGMTNGELAVKKELREAIGV